MVQTKLPPKLQYNILCPPTPTPCFRKNWKTEILLIIHYKYCCTWKKKNNFVVFLLIFIMCSPTLRIQMLRTSTNENTPLGYDEMKTKTKSNCFDRNLIVPYHKQEWICFNPNPSVLELTLIGMSYESKKNAHIKRHLGACFIRLNELGRV